GRRNSTRQGVVRNGRCERRARTRSFPPGRRQAAYFHDIRVAAYWRLRRPVMKVSELRSKNAAELNTELESLLKAHFNLRMQRATQQLSNTSQLGKVRRDIARVRTIMTE